MALKVIKWGVNYPNHKLVQITKLDQPESMFNSPRSFIKHYEKGAEFAYITDREGNKIEKDVAYNAMKKATALTR